MRRWIALLLLPLLLFTGYLLHVKHYESLQRQRFRCRLRLGLLMPLDWDGDRDSDSEATRIVNELAAMETIACRALFPEVERRITDVY